MRTAHSVASAERALREAAFDVVLLDCHLPDGDGTAIAASLRGREAERGGARARVVALTASADTATHARCLAAGMDACVVKPADADVLRAALTPDDDSAPPIVDTVRLETLARLDADVPGLLARIADDYARGAAEYVTRLRDALVAGDHAAVARAAHRLRGSSASAGAPRAAARAADVERRAREGTLGASDVDALAVAVEHAAAELLRTANRRDAATVAR